MSTDGCHLHGYLRLPRVPGHLELTAAGGSQDLEPSMTNTSHRVNHFSFSVPQEAFSARGLASGLPREATFDLTPLDGQDFTTASFQDVYEHHLRLVSMVSRWKIAYPFVHFGRVAATKKVPPQIRFYFDLEP